MNVQTTTEFWNRIEGARLGDGYELEQWVGDDGRRCYYLGASRSGDRPTLIAVVPADSEAAGEQLRCWETAAALSHPNLLSIYATGVREVLRTRLAYAVMERPENDLASVIRDRPLAADEARDAMRAVVAALEYLHSKGLAHGEVEAGNVVTVGHTIKLSCQAVREAGGDPPYSMSSDIRALGSMMYELLTGGQDHNPDNLHSLPEPFGAIIRGCTEGGWEIGRVAAALDPPPVLHPMPTVVEEAAPPAAVAPEEEAAPPAVIPPIEFVPPPPPPPLPPPSMESRLKRSPLWGYGIAALALGSLLLAVARRPAPAPAPQQTSPSATLESTPEPAAPAPRVETPPAPRTAKAPRARDAGDPAVWRVIAYTYTRPADAEHMAQSIRRRHPQLRPEVFAPYGVGGPLLIALGGTMTRNDALRMQRQAVAAGLPPDTFIRNFPRHLP